MSFHFKDLIKNHKIIFFEIICQNFKFNSPLNFIYIYLYIYFLKIKQLIITFLNLFYGKNYNILTILKFYIDFYQFLCNNLSTIYKIKLSYIHKPLQIIRT
jgi:hypothetical protein